MCGGGERRRRRRKGPPCSASTLFMLCAFCHTKEESRRMDVNNTNVQSDLIEND